MVAERTPKKEDRDTLLGSLEAAFAAAGIPVPLKLAGNVVAMIRRHWTNDGRLTAAYAREDALQLVEEAIEPLAGGLLENAADLEQLKGGQDQIVELLLRVLRETESSVVEPTQAELQLAQLRARREEEFLAGSDTGVLDDEILRLRREIRESPNLDVDDVLLRRYRLIEKIGRGHFATVWKALDRKTREFVAVKVLHVQWAGDRTRIARFESGAQKMRALHHPSIVPILDGPCRDGHQHFFVMPLLEGGDLRRAIAAGLDTHVALTALARASEGLTHAHERGLVHRDVKPDNILLDRHSQGYIADFDLVRDQYSTAGTLTHAAMGSFVYAAQELLENAKDADLRADIYGMGMTVLFVLLRRDPPALVAMTQPRVVESVNCDQRLRAAIRGAVAYDRERRHATVAMLVMALRERTPSVAFELAPIELPRGVIEVQLSELERRYVELDTPLDDPARVLLWAGLGNSYAALHRSRDATLCWSRALWEPTSEGGLSHVDIARRWADSEAEMLGLTEAGQVLGIVDVVESDLDEQMVRALAATVVCADLDFRASELERETRTGGGRRAPPSLDGELLFRLQRFFSVHGQLLDPRTLWLVRNALARLVRDRSAVFQVHGVIMASLREGIGLVADLPTFVQTHSSGSGVWDLERLDGELVRVRDEYFATRRRRSKVELGFPHPRTDAYVRLVLAWGFARIGRLQTAREELEAATEKLGAALDVHHGDAVHIAAYTAYRERVEQALEGMSSGVPFSVARGGPIAARERLTGLDRFKYDRLVQTSRVLEPWQNPDFPRIRDSEEEPFAGIAHLRESEVITALFDRRLANMPTLPPEARARELASLFEYLQALPAGLAVARLRDGLHFVDAAPLEARPRLLHQAVLLADYYGRSDLIGEVLSTLARSDAELTAAEPARYAELLTRCAPLLRRTNYDRQLAALLGKLDERVADERLLDGAIARLRIAAAFASLGEPERVPRAFMAAHALLPELTSPADYQVLLRELSTALSRSTPDQAIPGARVLLDRLADTTDSMSTNSHYCLAVINLVEAVVIALVGEDRTLSEWTRRWIEEDRHLLRRRIYRDLAAAR